MNQPDPGDTTNKLVRSLTEIALDEEFYKADLEVTDRYQRFSAEVLRLALLGMAAFGFLLKEVILKDEYDLALPQFIQVRWWLVAGLAGLAGSAMFALAHRFVSSDCIAYQVRYLRLRLARDKLLEGPGDFVERALRHNAEMQVEKDRLAKRLRWGGHLLAGAALCLGIGVILIGLGFARAIF